MTEMNATSLEMASNLLAYMAAGNSPLSKYAAADYLFGMEGEVRALSTIKGYMSQVFAYLNKTEEAISLVRGVGKVTHITYTNHTEALIETEYDKAVLRELNQALAPMSRRQIRTVIRSTGEKYGQDPKGHAINTNRAIRRVLEAHPDAYEEVEAEVPGRSNGLMVVRRRSDAEDVMGVEPTTPFTFPSIASTTQPIEPIYTFGPDVVAPALRALFIDTGSLADAAGIDRQVMTSTLAGYQQFTPEFCVKIMRALDPAGVILSLRRSSNVGVSVVTSARGLYARQAHWEFGKVMDAMGAQT